MAGDPEAPALEEHDEHAAKHHAAHHGHDIPKITIMKSMDDGSKKEQEVDARTLSSAERMKLVEAALETSDQDNEAFLRKMRERLDRVGMRFPSVEVRFSNIEIEASVYVGNRALPTLLNFTRNAISSFLTTLRILPDSRRKFPILHNVSGILKPGRMTLLLGPPGAGKSTLLKALAGHLDDDLKFSGEVLYNGHNFSEFVPVRTAAYVSQNDVHLGEMTVRETLDFSARVQGPGFRARVVEELEGKEAQMAVTPDPTMDAIMKSLSLQGNATSITTDYNMKILGLEVCSEIFVGNDMLRGISGGQKKRVTTGELIVGPKQALFMDEISTGLDSSTTFQITKCLRNVAHYQDATILIALLQPAPESYDLFDDILLLAEGHVVYHGPREDIAAFFLSMGFACPARKGEADFLQEVTSLKDQEQYWVKEAPYSYVSVQQFADAFANTKHGTQMAQELSTPYPKEKSPPGSLEVQKYGLPTKEMMTAVFERDFLLMKRNAFLYVALTIQMFIVALVTITVFLRTELSPTLEDGNFYLGAVFFGLIMMLFNGFAELNLLLMRLPVFYKQRNAFLYPVWSWELPMWLLSVPFSLWASVLWTTVTYWAIGFAPEASRFFIQMLLFFLVHQMSISLFRLIGSIGRTEVVSNTFGAFALIVLFLLGGFILAKDYIYDFWIWGYWISPLAYAQNALSVNEFLAPRWQTPTSSGQTVGDILLSARSLPMEQYWVWVGVGALIGFIVLFNLLTILSLQFLNPLGKPQPIISEELLEAKHAARTGEVLVSTSSRRRSSKRGTGSALDKFRMSTASIGNVTKVVADTTKSVATGAAHAAAGAVSSAAHLAGSAVDSVVHLGHADKDAKTDAEAATAGTESTDLESASRRGMVLPFQPLSLSFHDVNYYVDMPAEMKAEGATGDRLQLLKNVSGAFRPKVLTALVGVSGAGKTTLMDVLAGRKTGGYIEGDIRVSGFPKVHETFARVAGYCEQNDIHTPQVTVIESLLYSAWLRLSNVDKEVREEFVEEVMELVELDGLRDALVGLPGINGLSTEQRKRLTIAVELVANPSIIFMDEPTSGLDARAAAIVMRTVRNTVDTGRTVVCTIHQPSIDIFEAFDELLLMKRGGQVIYMGPLGTNSQILVDYFEAIEGVPKIRDGYNPATWMLEVSNPAAAEKLGVDFAEVFRNSEQFKKNEELIQQLSVPAEGQQDLHFPNQYATSYATQFQANLWKRSQMYWRAPDYNAVRYFFCTVMGLLIGGVFFNLGSKRSTQQEVLNIMGALYTASLFMGWNNAASVQPIVAVERTVFYRERAAGYYGAIPYALAQGVIEIPYIAVQTLIYSIVTYSMIHFEWTAGKFLWYTFYMFLTLLYFTYYGMMSIAITPNEQLSMVVSAFFFSLWNLFSGFLIPRPSIPPWWRWYYWIDPVSWTLYGLITSQLGDVTTTIAIPGVTPDPTIKAWISDYFGYNHDMLGVVVVVLFVFVFLFFTVFAYAIKKLNFQKR